MSIIKTKMRRKYLIVLIGLAILIVLIISEIQSRKLTLYTTALIERVTFAEPINLETGEINNAYFMIDSEGKNAYETTNGINNAIEYAYENNIEYIKLAKGNYLVQGITDNYENTGIILKSNIHLDLNGSTIQQIDNNSKGYVNISIYEVDNVKISNGILKGDSENHQYISGTTDEWGHGIIIRGSTNVVVENCDISNMTGDGIYIGKLYEGDLGDGKTSENIQIKNSYIHDCRRQGITVVCGENVKIYENEIFNIKGTNPKSGIDLESNNATEQITDIEIYRNKFYSLGSNRAIKVDKYIYKVKIYENEIVGRIYVYDDKTEIAIENNIISNGGINFYNNNQDRKYLKNAMIKENYLYNAEINLQDVETVYLEGNRIYNSILYIENVENCIVVNNQIINETTEKIENAYIYVLGERVSTLYKYNNTVEGQYNQSELIDENIIIIDNKEEVDNYISLYLKNREE